MYNFKKNWAGCCHKCTLVLVLSLVSCWSCQILMKLNFLERVFEKSSNIKFHKNNFIGNRVIPCERTDGQTDRQTDRHDKTNSHFSKFLRRLKIRNHRDEIHTQLRRHATRMILPAILKHKADTLVGYFVIQDGKQAGRQANGLEFYSSEQPGISINSKDKLVCVRHGPRNFNK